MAGEAADDVHQALQRVMFENPGIKVAVVGVDTPDGQRMVGLQVQVLDTGKPIATIVLTAQAALNVGRDLSAGILWAMGVDSLPDLDRMLARTAPVQ